MRATVGALTAAGALAGALLVLRGALAWATTVPQRAWRRVSAWLFHRPPESESEFVPRAGPTCASATATPRR